jgi:hypothetical protein
MGSRIWDVRRQNLVDRLPSRFSSKSGVNSPNTLGLLNFLLTESGANILTALTRVQSIDLLDQIAVKPADQHRDPLWASVFGYKQVI